ncbi:MAG: class I SAM-dependent methyltransferase [Candidatus Syntrophoarchaeum sp.]|nr:class I SAM-dependent methyltransferase [Candidatus Syntrophoarchaeum sp.]
MNKTMSNFHFKFMSFGYKFRDFFLPRKNILKEVGVKPGFHILDYGCGPGGYITAAEELVGKSGKVYALDIHPLAIQTVKNIASKKQLTNVETICSDYETGLADNSIDVVLLYDTFHDLSDPDGVLEELHRVLKPDGILSFSDHHMKENEIVSKITDKGLFKRARKGKMKVEGDMNDLFRMQEVFK